jgi:anti-anti-sigma factor
MLTHTTEKCGNMLIVRLNGRLDTDAATDLDAQFTVWMAKDCRKLVLNLADLNYTSSIGLRCFLWAAKTLKKSGRELVLCCAQPMVKEVFRISGLATLIPIQDAEPKAD